MVTANAARQLIQHYVDNFRRLPWRAAPGEPPPPPYVVWLSEVMLQQTTVATVVPRFERFVARWPTIEALAEAPESDILSEWAGLGYYARARNLIACAREVARLGGFPRSANDLRALPGVGDYTAAAIAAIAFGERAPAIDTNVERVIARVEGFRSPRRGDIRAILLAMMESARPGDLLQALMDLGATICRPRQPQCERCPLAGNCAAKVSLEPEQYPAARARKERPRRFGTAWWIERNGHVWLVRRPRSGLLGGMVALPGSDWTDEPLPGEGQIVAIRHVFTHFSLDLGVELRPAPVGEGWWQPLEAIEQVGLPTVYRKAATLMLRERQKRAA